MSREKQIEDMADILCEAKEHDCKGGNDCLCIKQAEALYNAGYRKQSEGEWIPTYTYTAEGTGIYKCSLCGRKSANPKADNFCPNCGAKMKGGAE